MSQIDLSRRTFRASPAFELLSLDRVPENERYAIADLEKRNDVFGLLKPRVASHGVKVVDIETALLLMTLKDGGSLPHFAKVRTEGKTGPILQLVLDSVLEVEIDGEFVSGARAHAALLGSAQIDATSSLGRLSMRAIRFGASLPIEDAQRVSERMYCYRRLPVTDRWHRFFGSDSLIMDHRDRPGAKTLGDLLQSQWTRVTGSTRHGWLFWSSQRGRSKSSLSYKLYLSPAPEHSPACFHVAIRVLGESNVSRFKFGSGTHGMLRPDKFVAYFDAPDAVHEVAEKIRREIDGVPAQGVPFSAELSPGGLLSWGVDPPKTEQLLQWQERPSWRMWLTNRLAVALVAAREVHPDDVDRRCAFAIDRVRLEGVDPRTWSPGREVFA